MPSKDESVRLLLQGLQARSIGMVEEAERILRSLLGGPRDPMLNLLLATTLPVTYTSMDDLLTRRRHCMEALSQLQQRGQKMDLTSLFGVPWMELAYQGMNDREPQRLMASLQTAPQPAPLPDLHRGGVRDRIRVGFCSAYFRDHTIGKLMRGVIANLNRDDFVVTVLATQDADDNIAQFCKAHSDAYIALPVEVTLARKIILGQKLDVIYYTDIGMQPSTYTLAYSRLAPVQCVTWGHPDTTGIPTVDYFISSVDLDMDDAQDAYTETLVRLKNIALYYYRPPTPSGTPARSEFGLPDTGTLYGCLQTLTKMHPQFDPVLADILRRDRTGILLLLGGQHPFMNQTLMARFKTTMPDVMNRIRFVPRMEYQPFLRFNRVIDVMLDPIHFGGGNTSLEALSYGIPVVTWPSRFLRGRILYALYKSMGMMDCVVNDLSEYADLAVRLGTDRAFRNRVSAKIQSTCGILYENPAGVRELEDFFRDAVTHARAGETNIHR